MTQEDIIRMAREAGLWPAVTDTFPKELKAFAALVAAAEREACAELADRMDACQDGEIGKAIRARGQPPQEALYGMNQDDWKDVVAAISKVRDGRGIYLACRPADVFKDWFLALGTAKVKEKK